jgi:hypothetical protein
MVRFQLVRGICFAAFAVFLLYATSPAEDSAGISSRAASIVLRAVLQQSLNMSVDPQGSVFHSFVQSSTTSDLPLTIKAHWVRGRGNVSVVVLSSSRWTGFENERPCSAFVSAQANAMEIESGKLPFSTDSRNEMLTIRAQVI